MSSTATHAPVQFIPQSGAAHGSIVPMASGQAATPTADPRTMLEKLTMLPKEPYAFGSDAYQRSQARKGELMKRVLGAGFVLGAVVEGINQYRKV